MGIAKPAVANQYLYVAPSILEELAMLAARHATSPSAILAAGWELSKHALYDRILPEAYVMPKPELYIMNPPQRFDADGTLTDEAIRQSVRDIVAALVVWTRRLRAD